MKVWQHLDKTDHLRRRAEGLIDSARGCKTVGASTNAYRPKANDVHKLNMKEAIQDTPGLSDGSESNEN
jgi:hypothetical protein